MKTLTIRWQRLLNDEAQTCDRCADTGDSVDRAADVLRHALAPLGIDVETQKQGLTFREFGQDTLQSNRIWIQDKSIEEWLGAEVGQSKCCSVCGESECRTVSVDGQTYEAIPEELILKAGLLAAAELVGQQRPDCCASNEPPPRT